MEVKTWINKSRDDINVIFLLFYKSIEKLKYVIPGIQPIFLLAVFQFPAKIAYVNIHSIK